MKVTRILVITALALLMAAPSFAVNTKLGMDFQNFFQYSNNAAFYNGGDTAKNSKESDFRYAERLRLHWTAEDDEKKVRGTVRFEFDFTAGYGSELGGTRNGPGGNFEGDRTNFELALAFIDFELPVDPASRVYMGLQGAEMNPLVFCDNAMGVRVARGMGDFDTALGWFRNDTAATEGFGGDDKVDYADLFAFDVAYDIGEGNKVAGFAYYIDDGSGVNFVQANDGVDNQYGGFDGDASAQTYWLGLTGTMEQGNFFGGATAIYQGGEVKSYNGTDDADIKAFLLNLEGSVKIDKTSITLGWLYTSGDDDVTDDDIENFVAIDCDQSWTGSVALLENYDPGAAFGGPWIGLYGANHIYLNVGYEINEKTDGRLGFIWFNAAEDVNEDDYLVANGESDTNIGYEINGQVDHNITENLTVGLAAGYLIGDDGWDALSADGEGDDLWRIMSRVRFKF